MTTQNTIIHKVVERKRKFKNNNFFQKTQQEKMLKQKITYFSRIPRDIGNF